MTATHHLATALALTSACLAAACVKPYEPLADDDGPGCIDDLGECPPDGGQDEAGDATGEETGGSDSTGGDGSPDPLGSGDCVGNFNPNVLGYRHQCEGSVDFSLEFDIPFILGSKNCIDMQDKIPDNQLCTESHGFGTEPYEQANVVSCCGPWDGDPEHEEPYIRFCEADLADQLCHTLVARLEHHLDWNHFAGFEVEAQNIINAISANLPGCTAKFLANDSDPSPARLDSFFKLGNDAAKWPSFVDFTIDVEIGEITGFSSPEDPQEWLTCTGLQGNDGEIFPKPEGLVSGTPYATLLASPTQASLAGPLILGTPVSAEANFHSVATGCSDPWCSRATFVVDVTAGEGAIDVLDLYAESNVTLRNQLGSYELAEVRIELDDVALGHFDEQTTLVIGAGEASFWIVGRDAHDPTSIQRFLAASATDIVATRRIGSTAWYLEPFVIEYVHFDGDVWTVGIPASTWQ